MRLLFIDTETGGTNPVTDALLDVALMVVEDDKVLAKKVVKIRSQGLQVSRQALEINKIDLRSHNECAISRTEAALDISIFISKWFEKPAMLVGHNVAFDRDFLKVLFEFEGLEFGRYITHRLLDTMSILTFMSIKGLYPEKLLYEKSVLDAALEYFGIQFRHRHSALGDVEATYELFKRLIK